MSVLSSALNNAWLIAVTYAALVGFSALVAPSTQRRTVVALGLVNHAGLFGLAALLTVPIISDARIDAARLATAIAIEVFCAFVFFVSCARIVSFLRYRALSIGDGTVVALLVAKLAFFAANYWAAGGQYGIFSDDSRIDFLATSPALSKTRYLDALIDFALMTSVLARLVLDRQFRMFDVMAVLALVAFGFLAGSKGGSVLLIASAILFLYAAAPRSFSTRAKAVIIASIAMVAIFYIELLSRALQLSFGELVDLILARFVLVADARLMSVDPDVTQYVLSQPHGTLLAELFRGISRAVGAQVAEYSMGVYQFQAELGTNNYVGSTSQLTALFLTYGGDFWLGEFALVALVSLVATAAFVQCLRSDNSQIGWVAAASLFQLNTTLSQGFEAYVQLLPICAASVVIIGLLSMFSATSRSRQARRVVPHIRGGSVEPILRLVGRRTRTQMLDLAPRPGQSSAGFSNTA